jgi:enhancer of mRNA-decapping protein 3
MNSSNILATVNTATASNQSSNMSSNNKNYRYDQMVLDTGEPMNFDQIKVPCKYITKRYVTDDGFIVPCIDYELRERLFEQSYKFGFKKERHIESLARSCTEMTLQLVGGPIRFSPKNNHQKPSILLFANSSLIQGCYAVCTARMLSTRQVKTHLFVYDNPIKKNKDDSELFQSELHLFNSGDSNYTNLITNVDDLKKLKSVDLIINGLESAATLNNFTLANQAWFRELIKYVESCKANVLTIDPCQEGSALQSKWSILPILPMAMSSNCGRVYLCDLGVTSSVFNSCNIKYQSPFGAKFLIPLHND